MEGNFFQELFDKYTNKRYLSKQELFYRLETNEKIIPLQIWQDYVALRKLKGTELPLLTKENDLFWYMNPPFMNKKINQIDSIAKRQIEEIAAKDIHQEVLKESIFDEAYYSSFIEGAFSTRQRAKEVVRSGQPKDTSEQMILNNYRALNYILENVNKEVNDQTIINLHQILTENTLTEEKKTERYRLGPVWVKGTSDEVIFEAPAAIQVEEMMSGLINFFNLDDDASFIHPVIKAFIIHFYIGYVHPFYDGNGRVARALAYWYLLRNGYEFFKFFSISSIIAKHRSKYYRAYLMSEEPENDITYFIDTQINMTIESITAILNKLSSIYNTEALNEFLEQLQILLTKRQSKFIKFISKKELKLITIEEYQKKFNVVYETARRDLSELENLGLLLKRKQGKRFVFVFEGLKGIK